MTKSRRMFPTLRCRMGDTIYYATYLTFRDVHEWIKPTDEVHRSKQLSDWIQRQLMEKHASGIATYLCNQEERFFNAVVIGIYGGSPSWSPLHVSSPPGGDAPTISDNDREMLDSSVGLLCLDGSEQLFAIDGQHRVEGIKNALMKESSLADDEIIALFVGHDTSEAGLQRTRRLFTTLNKTAKRVSDAARVALDEDDGFAVVTRKIIDDSGLFDGGRLVAFAPSGAIPNADRTSVTTIISLYHQLKDLYSQTLSNGALRKRDYASARPTDSDIDSLYRAYCVYWNSVCKVVEPVREVIKSSIEAGAYRKPRKNHVLMRPVGQRAFIGAVGVLVERGAEIEEAVERLAKVELWIHKKAWRQILWDPLQNVMLKSVSLAESFLLSQIGEDCRSTARQRKLDLTIENRA